MFVFIYNGNRAEALQGYNDDLVMSFAIALWVRDTALRLRAEGIELSKRAIQGIGQNSGIYTSEVQKNDSWEMDVKGKRRFNLVNKVEVKKWPKEIYLVDYKDYSQQM